MNRSTHIRRLATLAVIAGTVTVLVPVAQAGYGPNRIADSVDTARAAQQRGGSDLSSQQGYGINRVADSVDTALAAQARGGSGQSSMPDLVDRAVVAHQQEIASQSSPPDVLERTAAAGPGQYYFEPTTTGSGFDWGDFGLGTGVGIGLMLLLGGLGAGLVTRRQVRTA
jgi:hypothetical protein